MSEAEMAIAAEETHTSVEQLGVAGEVTVELVTHEPAPTSVEAEPVPNPDTEHAEFYDSAAQTEPDIIAYTEAALLPDTPHQQLILYLEQPASPASQTVVKPLQRSAAYAHSLEQQVGETP